MSAKTDCDFDYLLLPRGGSIFINAWHLDSYFKYRPSEYHEFVFNNSPDEWPIADYHTEIESANKRFSFLGSLLLPIFSLLLSPFKHLNI